MKFLRWAALTAVLALATVACSSSDDGTTDASAPAAGSPAGGLESPPAAEPSTPALESLGAASPVG